VVFFKCRVIYSQNQIGQTYYNLMLEELDFVIIFEEKLAQKSHKDSNFRSLGIDL
jgi:hypothetical protein